ncbi:MAG: LysM peptidoglycan-binding domain-containing protein [Bacteriovoracaceae bacterium]|nr:LysM peptidoglycan-binding domain-containing protein [Bacteriovoracaceae bacterium]
MDSLDLVDDTDADVLFEDEDNGMSSTDRLDLSELEEVDDLDSLKDDIGDNIFKDSKKKQAKDLIPMNDEEDSNKVSQSDDDNDEEQDDFKLDLIPETKLDDPTVKVVNEKNFDESGEDYSKYDGTVIFDLGKEEKELLKMAKFVQGKIPEKEWNEISITAKVEKYEIQKGDWLWKISQKLFGSGFYYSKIWSMNPHITNPHEIEPGMVLVFDTGTSDEMPEVKFGDFTELSKNNIQKNAKAGKLGKLFDYADYTESGQPAWFKERELLAKSGAYFQFVTGETYQDLADIGQQSLEDEYQKYSPPFVDIFIKEPSDNYDRSGFDKDSKITFNYKEGYFLNTFVTSNIVQDLGFIDSFAKEKVFIHKFDTIYVNLDTTVKVKPGDQFSIYSAEGRVTHPISDREGYRYTIVGQIKTLRQVNHLWECDVTELSGIVQRKDRITVYTPKINKIYKGFAKRNIEAAIIGSYRETSGGMGFGEVVYLDRGRADGVALGTIFELFDFTDRGTGKRITPDPTYKIGELNVISLTDNFATALISQSSNNIQLGTLALSKSAEQAARDSVAKSQTFDNNILGKEGTALDELDVELNFDDISQDLLDKADKIQLTEDELDELERQEREKSIIKDHERDLKELEKLESEISDAESSLNEAKVDEDKFLEQQDLNFIEKKNQDPDADAFESLDDIEDEIGLKYMDEDLNARENPYGLTEFDLEEIDELLNSEQK